MRGGAHGATPRRGDGCYDAAVLRHASVRRSIRRLGLALAAVVAFVGDAASQEQELRVTVGEPVAEPVADTGVRLTEVLDGSIRSMVAIGDHDEDGVSDLALVVSGQFASRRDSIAPWSGVLARVVSGADGAFLHEFQPTRLDETRHWVLEALPRTDRPAALAVGIPDAGPGIVDIHEVDGRSLRIVPTEGVAFGTHLVDVTDVDGDGEDDLAVTSNQAVEIRSSATGELMRSWEGIGRTSRLVRAGSRDGTGFQAVVWVGFLAHGTSAEEGWIRLLPLRDGQPERSFRIPAARFRRSSIESPGDVDGDGTWDVGIATWEDGGTGGASLLSGQTGHAIVERDLGERQPCSRLELTTDEDGDGVLDLLCAVTDSDTEPRAYLLLSGRTLETLATIPAPTGAYQQAFTPVYVGDADGSRLLGVADDGGDPHERVLVFHRRP